MKQPTAARTTDERRRFRRYPVWVDISIRRADRAEPIAGLLVDLSLGGALIRCYNRDMTIGEPVSFAIESTGHELYAAVLRVQQTWNGTLYHMEFPGLESHQEVTLLELLDQFRPEFDAHQRFLARRANTNARPQEMVPAANPGPLNRLPADSPPEPIPTWDEHFAS